MQYREQENYLSAANELTRVLNMELITNLIMFTDHLADILLYGSNVYNHVTNRLILHETITYILKSQRFDNIEAFSS